MCTLVLVKTQLNDLCQQSKKYSQNERDMSKGMKWTCQKPNMKGIPLAKFGTICTWKRVRVIDYNTLEEKKRWS